MKGKGHFVVVAYDVVSDRRRLRLHERLKDFGIPVQYSVFECLLAGKELQRMQAMVKREIDESTDKVRYYFLCEACRRRARRENGGLIDIPPGIVV